MGWKRLGPNKHCILSMERRNGDTCSATNSPDGVTFYAAITKITLATCFGRTDSPVFVSVAVAN